MPNPGEMGLLALDTDTGRSQGALARGIYRLYSVQSFIRANIPVRTYKEDRNDRMVRQSKYKQHILYVFFDVKQMYLNNFLITTCCSMQDRAMGSGAGITLNLALSL